jgi:hypothetical protein
MSSPTPDKKTIPYVQSVGDQDVPPPYHFPGVSVYAFVFPVQMQPIQDYCDTYLNIGSEEERGFVYKPAAAWPFAMLLIIDYPAMVSSMRGPQNIGGLVPYQRRGMIAQREAFVALPVVRYGKGALRLALASAVDWAIPFIAVANPMSAVCGREMVGLPKLLGEVDFSKGTLPGSFHAVVRLPGWDANRGGVVQQMMTLLEVVTDPPLPTYWGKPPETTPWSLFQSSEASWAVEEMGSAANYVEKASLGMFPTAMRTVSLKQFRDAAHPDQAVYQALVTCRSRYGRLSNFKFYNEKDVNIVFHCEGSLAEAVRYFLEVPKDAAPIKVDPIAAYTFNADIDFEDMRRIYRFPIDSMNGAPATSAERDVVAPWFRPWRGFFGLDIP